jgi:hypothetical protein
VNDGLVAGSRLWKTPQQLASGNLQALSDLGNRRDAKVSQAALGACELDRMQPGTMRGLFLRQPELGATGLDVGAHAFLWLHTERCSAL